MKYRVIKKPKKDIAKDLAVKIALIISFKSLFYNFISFMNLNNSQEFFCDYINLYLN